MIFNLTLNILSIIIHSRFEFNWCPLSSSRCYLSASRLWRVMALFIDTTGQLSLSAGVVTNPSHLSRSQSLAIPNYLHGRRKNTANNFIVRPKLFSKHFSLMTGDCIACRESNEHNEWSIKSIRQQLCSQMRRKVDGRTGVRKWSTLTTTCRARKRGQQRIWDTL